MSLELTEALLGQADAIEQSLEPGWLLRKPPESDPLLRAIAMNQILLSRAMAELLMQVDDAHEEIKHG